MIIPPKIFRPLGRAGRYSGISPERMREIGAESARVFAFFVTLFMVAPAAVIFGVALLAHLFGR